MTSHVPVLKTEVIEYLRPRPNEDFVDCTLGGGGHASAILDTTGPRGKLLGIERDPDALKRTNRAFRRYGKRAVLVHGRFSELRPLAKEHGFDKVRGILFDLGFSSDQLESGRGFTFQKTEPLDMRYDPADQLTAAKILNYHSRQELERIFAEYGGEKFASQIAKAVVARRSEKPFATTAELVGVIKEAVPEKWQKGPLHPATRAFQALRIAVNGETGQLETGLRQAVLLLEKEGRIAVISFHSGEDRAVKNFMRDTKGIERVTKGPVTPDQEELRTNPRARSAKLRVAQKL